MDEPSKPTAQCNCSPATITLGFWGIPCPAHPVDICQGCGFATNRCTCPNEDAYYYD